MANGDIPITGGAPKGRGDHAAFTLNCVGSSSDDKDHLVVRTKGKKLHIRVDNGAGKIFDEDLESPGWTLEITPRKPSP
jgi:hypothetical protein